MCRPAVVPCTIFADLISGSRVPFSAQDAGCVCLLLWCGAHCSLTSVIYTVAVVVVVAAAVVVVIVVS